MRALKEAQQLEILELIDVDFTFTDADETASFLINRGLRESITLPRLKSYKLRTGLDTEVGEYNRKEVFASWIPFQTPDPIEGIVKAGIDLDIYGKYDGTIFIFNSADGEIQSRLSWTNDVLTNLPKDFICQKLVVFFCYAELDVRFVPHTITHLELTGAVLKHGMLGDMLGKLSSLQTLYLDGVQNEKRTDDPGDLALKHLGNLNNLKALWLNHMALHFTPKVTLPHLQELILDSRMENIDLNILENFPNLFPNLQTLGLIMDNELVNPILGKSLTIDAIKNIFVKASFIRHKDTPSTLKSSELKNIFLEFNPEDDQYFTLKKENGKWTGVPVDSSESFLKGFLTTPFVAFWD